MTGAVLAMAFACFGKHHKRNFVMACIMLIILFGSTWWWLHQTLLQAIA